ncbi:MAG: MgPME-cyclase complex family protein [Nodosilinea sp.]
MTTYYYAVASQKFLLEEEPLEEVIKERRRYYQEQEQEVNFWVVKSPAFLETPELARVKASCPQPAVALVSTSKQFITWAKLRFEYVGTGEFEAPSDSIADPLASLDAVAS